MEVVYHWHNTDHSDALQEYTRKKLSKLTAHFDNVRLLSILFQTKKLQRLCRIIVHTEDARYIASSNEADLYHAADATLNKLERQIRRSRERERRKRRH